MKWNASNIIRTSQHLLLFPPVPFDSLLTPREVPDQVRAPRETLGRGSIYPLVYPSIHPIPLETRDVAPALDLYPNCLQQMLGFGLSWRNRIKKTRDAAVFQPQELHLCSYNRSCCYHVLKAHSYTKRYVELPFESTSSLNFQGIARCSQAPKSIGHLRSPENLWLDSNI